MKIITATLFFILSLQAAGITDMQNRSVDYTRAHKIAAVGPGALRLLVYMQAQSRLAGIEQIELGFEKEAPYRRVLDAKALRTLPVIGRGGPGRMPNIEALIQSGAQMVFTSFLSPAQNDMLAQKSGLPVVALSYGAGYGGSRDQNKLTAVQRSLQLLGKILDKDKRARTLIDFMQKNQNLLGQIFKDQKEAYIGATGYKGARGILASEGSYQPFAMLGIQNALAPKQKGSFTTSYEKLLQRDPQYLFVDALGKAVIKDEFAKKKAVLQSLRAYREQKIFWLYPYNFYNTNIENIFVNAYIIADRLGIAIDTQAVQKEIYALFLPGLTTDDILPLPEAAW